MTDNNRRFARFIALPVLAIIGIAALAGTNKSTATAAKPMGTCKADWSKCAGNSEMANNFDGWQRAKNRCKDAAADLAKYGTPEWPSPAFSSFYPGTNYLSGTITVVEPRAKFQNGFGAMVHSRVECEYDLKSSKVVNVTIAAR